MVRLFLIRRPQVVSAKVFVSCQSHEILKMKYLYIRSLTDNFQCCHDMIRSVFSESCKHRLRATLSLEKLNFELLKSSEISFLSLLPSQELKVELLAQKAHF